MTEALYDLLYIIQAVVQIILMLTMTVGVAVWIKRK